MEQMNIFISHNHRDKAFVRQLSSDLRKEGFSVWLDEDMISVGERWADKITEALENSDAILVVLSANSSSSEFQSSEIAYAISSQRKNPSTKLIPIILDKKAELPFFLKDVVYADFSTSENYRDRLEYLKKALTTPRPSESNILVSDQRKIDAIKSEKEYLREESSRLENQTVVWSSTVLGVVASVISAITTLFVVTAASEKWFSVLFKEWGGFISGLLAGVLVSLAAYAVSRQVQRRSTKRGMGDGK